VLAVELLKAVSPNYRLTVETERVMDSLPATVRVEIPHALEVKRETGVIGMRGEEELELAVQRAQELARVDVEEFARVTGQKESGLFSAFRFLKPEFVLEARAAAQQPQIEAVVHHTVRVGPEQATLVSTVDYTIKRAGVFLLRIALPVDYRLEAVTGANLLQWSEQGEPGARRLDLTLKERALGSYSLRLDLARNWKAVPAQLELAAPHPLGTQKLTGFVAVSAEPGVALQPAAVEGLTEIPAASIAAAEPGSTVLAYKFLAPDPQLEPRWKLSVSTEAVEPWIRAEIVNTLTVSDSLMTGRALARFDIQNAPVKELRLFIPAAFRNVEIAGANIRRRDQDGEQWRIEFQSKLRGQQTLSVTWEQPREATNRLELRGVGAAQVERETGVLSVVARPPLQVTEAATADLKPMDIHALPNWAGRPDDATVLAYQYARPGYALAVDVKHFDEAEALPALIERLSLTTVVADDGQQMTAMSLAVRNHGRQHLEVALPVGAAVWSAFIAGQAVRSSVQAGRLLLPLEQSTGDDAPLDLELTYVQTNTFPRNRGLVHLTSPQFDVPFQSARWELFLPPDHRYGEFTGTMNRESAATEAASFSILDYSKKESESKAEMARAVKSELASAQTKLSKGKVREALAEFNRARNKWSDATTDEDSQRLELQLRRAQGGNLISAQNAFSESNGGYAPAGQQPSFGNAAAQLQYDASAAEAQWTKLQQAQELGATRVQPIRVNLPTRGLRYAFTQVLQTQVRKPMTIGLLAVNDKVISWPGRILTGTAVFLALWGVVAVMARRPRTA